MFSFPLMFFSLSLSIPSPLSTISMSLGKDKNEMTETSQRRGWSKPCH